MKKGAEVVAKLLLSFFIIQILGLYIGIQYVGAGLSITENPQDIGNAFIFLGYVIGGAIFMLLLIKFFKKRLLFLILEGMVIFTSTVLVSSVFVDELPAVLFGIAMVVGRHLNKDVKFVATAIACIGVGALMGSSMGVLPAALFALGLSAYDLIAVFGTKHMITMAKEFSEKDLAFSLRIGEKGRVVGKERVGIELGTGDIVVPIMLSVSLYADSLNVLKSMGAVVGATIGLLFVVYIVVQKRGYLPALPPIVILCLVGSVLF